MVMRLEYPTDSLLLVSLHIWGNAGSYNLVRYFLDLRCEIVTINAEFSVHRLGERLMTGKGW